MDINLPPEISGSSAGGITPEDKLVRLAKATKALEDKLMAPATGPLEVSSKPLTLSTEQRIASSNPEIVHDSFEKWTK